MDAVKIKKNIYWVGGINRYPINFHVCLISMTNCSIPSSESWNKAYHNEQFHDCSTCT